MNGLREPLLWGVCLLLTGSLLSACQPPPASEAAPTRPAPTSMPTATPGPLVQTVPAGALIVNENPWRSSLFNINTLAYERLGMDEVEVINLTYAFRADQPLTLDVYYPPGTPVDAELPAVVFGLGYRMSKEPLRNAHFYTSWGRLVAAAGMAGITYDTEQPDQDLEILMAFIRDNAAALRIDPARIGFHSTSANPPTVMSYLMQEGREGVQFSVYYYGHSLTPDRKYTAGFEEQCAHRCLAADLTDVTYVDPELPLFIVKVGKDSVPSINQAMDHFIDYVRAAGAPVTVVVYEDGEHGFDTQQHTEESAEIIAQTLDFMLENFGILE